MSGIIREVSIGDCRLILGDARDILPGLVGVADVVVSDLPYKLTSGGGAGGSMTGKFAPEKYDNGGDLMDMVRWSEIGGPIYRACRADADAYIMANDKNVFQAHDGFNGAGFKFHNLLTWDKGAPTRNRWYMKNQEYTLYLWKGRARTINSCGSKQNFRCPRPKGLEWHPTPKPVPLMAHYINNSTEAGAVVLDPFAGTGATLLAAVAFGRKVIGIEVDATYFERLCDRVADTCRSGFDDIRAECAEVEAAQKVPFRRAT